MDFGVALATPADAWKTVQRAEAAGFRTAWFYDTQMLSADLFTTMGAAAVKTDKIRLATGMLIPSNRIAPVAANALASLNHLAPGRIDCGIGTGFTGRLTMGLGSYKLADMGEYIRVMQALLRGETAELRIEGQTRKIRFLNPEAGLINIDGEIPFHVSAFGPKGRRLAAELDANWVNVDFSENFAGAAAALEDMNDKWRAAGHDPATKRKTIFIWGSVLREGERADCSRAKAETGPFAVQVLHAIMEAIDRGADPSGGADEAGTSVESPVSRGAREYRALYETYEPADQRYLTLHRGHLLFLREDEEHFATEDLIRATTVTGTPSELRERLSKVKDAGYDEIVVQITPGHEGMIEDWMGVFETL
jgi:5,10-methylenetetrahydromethanopterin reductase